MLDPCNRFATLAILAAFAILSRPALAQAPDPADVAAGLRLFQQKANCQACHGWAGDGQKTDSQMPDGANLRESKLDREALVIVIKCGRPGSQMPAFDKFAYSDGRCFGLKQTDLAARKLTMPDPPATLQVREVEMLADFMMVKVIAKGAMTRAQCADFWGAEREVCGGLPR